MTYFQDFVLLHTPAHRRDFQFTARLAVEHALIAKIIAVFFVLMTALAVAIGLSIPDNPRQHSEGLRLLDSAPSAHPCHYDEAQIINQTSLHGFEAMFQICGQ